MKKTFLMSALLMLTIAAFAQQPVITFQKTEHDFGKINEEDGRVSTIFEFKNEGMEPLVLSNVRASCGCTTPTWTRTPIEPGQTGSITVTYNPNGRPGRFQKTVTITSNASNPSVKVYIKGEVLPKQVKPKEEYTVKMGDLSLKGRVFDFKTINKGDNKSLQIEYANKTDKAITVDVLLSDKDNYLNSLASLKTVEPGQTGTITVNFDAAVCKLYGPVETALYVTVNGKRQLTDEYRLDVKADIKEDFTGIDAQTAPIIEIDSKINLGTVKAGKKASVKAAVKNVGVNPLYIRRILPADELVTLNTSTKINGGKSATMTITAGTIKADGTHLEPGVYRRNIRLITNDPKKSNAVVEVTWTVE